MQLMIDGLYYYMNFTFSTIPMSELGNLRLTLKLIYIFTLIYISDLAVTWTKFADYIIIVTVSIVDTTYV